jgi:hypothetical protein
MKKLITALLSGMVLVLLSQSCYYDNEEDLYPNNAANCDTSNVTYTSTISSIMSAYCNTCHSGPGAQKGYITDNYDDLSVLATSGLLWKAVNHESGVIPMPYQSGQLSSCNLLKIKTWIDKGVPKK